MFKQNEIVKIDLAGYKQWYEENVRGGVWMLDEELCYIDSESDDNTHAYIHEIEGCIMAAVPVEFVQSTGEFYVKAAQS